MADEKQIQALLRLKRFEQPPPGYFEDFLANFQRRQRSELLREPAWKIAFDRVAAFFSESSGPVYRYAAGTLCVLAAGVTLLNLSQEPAGTSLHASTAVNVSATPSSQSSARLIAASSPVTDALQSPEFLKSRVASQALDANPPRYVLDVRPVAYEFPGSF